MNLRELVEKYRQFKIPSLSIIREKASKHSKTSLLIIVILVVLLALALQYIPHIQVAQFNITNQNDVADAENSYRATLAQILGGIAIGVGLYYTWRRINIAEEDLKITQKSLKIAQDNLKVTQENLEVTQKVAQENLKIAQESQITERFTRAVDQLGAIDQFGNPAIEIRLGGIYALERIASESEKDYWPIMEILTAYVRNNSGFEEVGNKKVIQLSMDIQANEITKKEATEVKQLSLDIQAVLTILGRRKYAYNNEEFEHLNLSKTILNWLTLKGANLEGTDFTYSYLQGAYLENIHFENADFTFAHLEVAELRKCNLEKACFENGHFDGAYITKSNLKKIFSRNAHLEETNLIRSNLERAYLKGANLKGALLLYTNFEEADLERACFKGANLAGANLAGANLAGANLAGAYLKGAKNLTVDQLSKVKTLYKAELDDEMEKLLREKYPAIFEKTD